MSTWCSSGVHGMDPRSGFTCPNLLEADTDRALIEAGRRLVVVADHSKWGVIGISSIARLDQADVLITDVGLSPEARAHPGRVGPRADRRGSRTAGRRSVARGRRARPIRIIPSVVATGLVDAAHAD